MPRKPKNEPMTAMEISELNQQARNTKIYKAESMELAAGAISDSVNNALAHIKRNDRQPKIDLNDSATVKRIIESYLESCASDSVFPTMAHIAMCLGYTDRNLRYYMQKNPDTETGKFLQQVHDIIAGILSENALKGTANNITSIFLLKALYGYRDQQTIELVNGTPISDDLSIDELAFRAGLLSD